MAIKERAIPIQTGLNAEAASAGLLAESSDRLDRMSVGDGDELGRVEGEAEGDVEGELDG